MDFLLKHFDHYIINARIAPAFFVVLPLTLTAIAWIPGSIQLAATLLAVLISFGVISFLSILISNQGNRLQDRLFLRWGGPPTTALLRFSDNTLDPYTKQRYRECLQQQLPSLLLPSQIDEKANPTDADAAYASAVNYLREKTRNRQAYPMVYGDNVAYGFARNLLLLRRVGLTASIISIVLTLILLWTQDPENVLSSDTAIFPLVVLLVGILMVVLFWVVVNEDFVRGRAIRYAKSLLASCETISGKAEQDHV